MPQRNGTLLYVTRPTLALVITVVTLILNGCAGGLVTTTAYTAATTAAGISYESRMKFRDQLERDYETYKDQFKGSDCRPEEYKISDKIYEFIKKSPATVDGYAEAQNILLDIYRNEDQPRKVRAHALYYAALTEVQKEDGSVQKTREYLRRVKTEFPGTHDCAVDTLLDDEGKI